MTAPELVFDPAPLQRCAQCDRLLSPHGPSLWFCAGRFVWPGELPGGGVWSPCQDLWYGSLIAYPGAVDPDLGLVLVAGP